jgi:transposase
MKESKKKKEVMKYSVGIDISMDDFHVCVSGIDSEQCVTVRGTRSFKNTNSGHAQCLFWAKKLNKELLPMVFTMEATGVYYEELAWHLHLEKEHVSVVVPNKAKKYLQSLSKSKNDKTDAIGLAQMGAEKQLKHWIPLTDSIYELRTLTRHRESCSKQRTATINRIHALEHGRVKVKPVLKQLKSSLKHIDKQIEEMEELIKELIMSDPLLAKKCRKITKVKGIGIITFANVVAETNGFAAIENHRQLVSYAGYDVVENQSGNHVGKTRISKKGNSRIRAAMYFPALQAVLNKEPVFVNLYERVFERTGIKMKAYVAVQKKLLELIYFLWIKDEEYDPNRNRTSGNDEPKFLFSQQPIEQVTHEKLVVSMKTETTQDRLPCKDSPEVLFSQGQIYKKKLL